jgi:hypothetical protein
MIHRKGRRIEGFVFGGDWAPTQSSSLLTFLFTPLLVVSKFVVSEVSQTLQYFGGIARA